MTGPPKPTLLEVFMLDTIKYLVFRWPKPLFSMVLGAHGIFYRETHLPEALVLVIFAIPPLTSAFWYFSVCSLHVFEQNRRIFLYTHGISWKNIYLP